MSPKLQPVRGTHDILPEEARRWRAVADVFFRIAECYGFGELRTPMFEFTEVFHRTLGETSDVVTKEMYTFSDRGGESLTLRPEVTAAVARAFITHNMEQQLPAKLAYFGPAFRYERPQKGRQRQFHQAGIELLGIAEPVADIEVMAFAAHFLAALGLKDHVKLELNSLGDSESRTSYRTALVEYFSDHREKLSEDSRLRLEKNPLRILDSKDEGDRKINANAPVLPNYFTPHSTDFFAKVLEGLDALGIPYITNHRLVRGLDYYNHVVFEFVANDDSGLGAQNTVLSGGRYDGLIAQMGGHDVPGVGCAAGLERLILAIEAAQSGKADADFRPIAVMPIDEAQELEALKLTQMLRQQNIIVELITRGNMGKKMKRADKLNARFVLMLGEEEIKTNSVAIKNLATGEQKTVPQAELLTLLKH